MTTPALVSIHGGHSGQFCGHAQDTLEEVIAAYIAKGFDWVGITEHMPPAADRFMYPEEREAGYDTVALLDRFDQYMSEGRRLQEKYADQLEIFIGFETEFHQGALSLARRLMDQYRPDYVLGGIHHVADIAFDFGAKAYQKAVAACGGHTALYCRYFDMQHDLIKTIEPKVVAHFDLIRIYDPDYLQRWQTLEILDRIERNLQAMKDLDLILDYNVAALRKGAKEPYISQPILEMARDMEVAVVPGDDSHGAAMVGAYIHEGIAILKKMGFPCQWPKPAAARKP